MSVELKVRSKGEHSQKLRTSFIIKLSDDRIVTGKLYGSWLSFYVTFDQVSLNQASYLELREIAELLKGHAAAINADPRFISVWDHKKSLSLEQKEAFKDFIFPFLTQEDIVNDDILRTLVL